MHGSAFDRLSRAFVRSRSRRDLLGLLSSVPVAGLRLGPTDTAAKPGGSRHRQHDTRQRQHDRHGGTHSEACIPTGKPCPSKKPRGKKGKKLSCQHCCQQATATDATGKTVCACKPTGAACTPDTAFSCCTGICTNGVCTAGHCPPCSGTTPICQGTTCVACTSTSQCPASTVCAPSGACEACTVSGGGGALATAVAAAQDGDTLYVCAGTYTGGFEITTTITIIGAGQGADGTIIEGGSAVVNSNAGTAAQPVTVERVRIQHGSRGVAIAGGALALRDCTVRDNGPAIYGAGITNFHTIVMTRCTVEANTAVGAGTGFGGGIYSTGPATLIDCLIQGNTGTHGGGIYNINGFDAFMTLTGTRVTDNTAPEGSGVLNDGIMGSTVTLAGGSTVCANHPTTNQCVNVTGPGCTDTCPGA